MVESRMFSASCYLIMYLYFIKMVLSHYDHCYSSSTSQSNFHQISIGKTRLN